MTATNSADPFLRQVWKLRPGVGKGLPKGTHGLVEGPSADPEGPDS